MAVEPEIALDFGDDDVGSSAAMVAADSENCIRISFATISTLVAVVAVAEAIEPVTVAAVALVLGRHDLDTVDMDIVGDEGSVDIVDDSQHSAEVLLAVVASAAAGISSNDADSVLVGIGAVEVDTDSRTDLVEPDRMPLVDVELRSWRRRRLEMSDDVVAVAVQIDSERFDVVAWPVVAQLAVPAAAVAAMTGKMEFRH